MSRPLLLTAFAGVFVAGGAVAFFLTRPAVQPAQVAKPVSAPAPDLPPPVLAGRARSSEGASAGARSANPEAARNNRTAASDADAPAAAGASEGKPPASRLGTLHIESDAAGVQVFLDRVLVGVAPVTIPDVKPGPHRLNLSLPGYEPVSETIEVAPGPRDLMFKFKEVRLDARADVVHKHRIGSCKGTLIATPRGLRYETADKDDAFSSGILEIEALQIDYLENRLRVVLKGGKRLDFSDPAGNADHLFVFHRDVEKARDRLKKGDPPAPE